MLRARVSCERAQAHLEALDGTPESKAWAAVMDAQWDGLRLQARAEALYEAEAQRELPGVRVPFEQVSLATLERWLDRARRCESALLL
jgi:hypothetical protein